MGIVEKENCLEADQEMSLQFCLVYRSLKSPESTNLSGDCSLDSYSILSSLKIFEPVMHCSKTIYNAQSKTKSNKGPLLLAC